MDVFIKVPPNVIGGSIQSQFIVRYHIGQHRNNIFINIDPVMICFIKILFPKICFSVSFIFSPIDISIEQVEKLGKHYPAYADKSGDNNSPAFGRIGRTDNSVNSDKQFWERIGHVAPPCGKDFSTSTKSYHGEGLFIIPIGGAA